jgi:hypothetical protein
MRSATSRTLRNENGSYTLQSFTRPIHYRDAGAWQAIDNSLVASGRLGYAWENKANAFRVFLKDRMAEDAIAIEVGGYTYTLGPEGAAASPGAKDRSEASYAGIAAATDITYRVTETGLKETLVLRTPDAPTSFTFLLKVPLGSSASVDARGAVVVADPTGAQAFVLDPPWAAEAAALARGEAPSAGHASLSAEPVVGGYEITLSVDEGWLRAPGRRFPVIVDPTATIQPGPSSALETWVTSVCGSCFFGPNSRLHVGTTPTQVYRSLVAFDVMSIPWHSLIQDATLSLYYDACVWSDTYCATTYHNIQLHRLSAGPWTAWNTGAASATWDWAEANHDLTSLVTVLRLAGWPDEGWHDFNNPELTALVQRWVRSETPNYGFMLRLADETPYSGGPDYYSGQATGVFSDARPVFEVTYTANATHGWPPAPPPVASSLQVWSSTAFATMASRSLLRTSDGVLIALNPGAGIGFSAPPYQSWTIPSGTRARDGYLRTDTNTFYTVDQNALLGVSQLYRWPRTGTTTWGPPAVTTYDATGQALAVVRTGAAKVWAASYASSLDRLTLSKSTDDGANFLPTNQVAIAARQGVRLLNLGTFAGALVTGSSGPFLRWRTETDGNYTLDAGTGIWYR